MDHENEGPIEVVEIGKRSWVVNALSDGTVVATPTLPIVCIQTEEGWRPARIHEGHAVLYGTKGYETLAEAAAVHDHDPSEVITEIRVQRSDTRLGADMLMSWIAICLVNTVWPINMMDALLGTLLMFFFTNAHDIIDDVRSRK